MTEAIVALLAVQALVSWTAAAVVAVHRGAERFDDVLVLVLAPLWGLGFVAAAGCGWRRRRGLRHAVRAAEGSVRRVLGAAWEAVIGWPRALGSSWQTFREASGGGLPEINRMGEAVEAADPSLVPEQMLVGVEAGSPS